MVFSLAVVYDFLSNEIVIMIYHDIFNYNYDLVFHTLKVNQLLVHRAFEFHHVK